MNDDGKPDPALENGQAHPRRGTPDHAGSPARASNGRALRIIKLGGSLLNRAGLAADFQHWLAGQKPARNIIIAGGGRMADEVREWAQKHDLDDTTAHRLCIHVMSVTARAVSAMLGDVPLVASLVVASGQPTVWSSCVLDVAPFLLGQEPQCGGTVLAQDWSVTSDSIAARVACLVSAEELVLIKPASPPADRTLASAVQSGYVDEFLPKLASEISQLRCVNARVSGWPEAILLASRFPHE